LTLWFETKLHLNAIRLEVLDWVRLAQDSVEWQEFVDINVSSISMKCGEFVN